MRYTILISNHNHAWDVHKDQTPTQKTPQNSRLPFTYCHINLCVAVPLILSQKHARSNPSNYLQPGQRDNTRRSEPMAQGQVKRSTIRCDWRQSFPESFPRVPPFPSILARPQKLNNGRGAQSLVIFAAMIASLSWVTLSGVHWSGPAIWYMGIVLALTAMVVGAQQTVVLPSDVDLDTDSAVQQRLKRDGKARPRRDMLFVSQSPIMCFSLSVTCFLGGLSSVIISPLTQSPQWGPEAKVAFFDSLPWWI